MTISFIATVYNEEKEIEAFLASLFSQTRQPDEIVIVDGGSSDQTVAKIQSASWRTKFKILIKKGNRAVGRNEAIRNSTGDIIAVSDAGCILDKDWLRNIVKPFENPKIDVVSGYYKPVAGNIFEKCLATYTCVMPDKLNKSFLPSSRSVAFKKEAWKKVGGYPEKLDTCEDLVFASSLRKHGFSFFLAKNAIVYWPQRKNLVEAFKQFFIYARGDGKGRFIRQSIPFLFARYLIGINLLLYLLASRNIILLVLIFVLLFLYLVWSVSKNYNYVMDWKAIFILPVLQIISDIAVLAGTSIGLLESLND